MGFDINNIVHVLGGGIIALGTIAVSILVFVARSAWRISKAMANQTATNEAIISRQDAHDIECEKYREKVDKRLDEGSEQFKQIERSLGRIEGAIGAKRE